MPKNIVVCCDGTGNEYGQNVSNVIKLYQALTRDANQDAYYHPGVGTMGAKNALTAVGKVWTKYRGLFFGYGLSENIADAYQYLMRTYEPDDRIFIFGFSRGAYTARALCGMLQMFGLLSRGNEGLIPYAIRLFKSNEQSVKRRIGWTPSKFKTAAGFKKTFCRACKPHFLGLWDTVSSVGWVLDPIGLKQGHLPYTYNLEEVSTIRHAVSIDERRAFFRQNLVREEFGRDIKQVWFAGVHSDVGGSYPEAESGLSKISLRWMLREAEDAGMLLDNARVDKILGADPNYSKPLANAVKHNSLTLGWWWGEFWPKWTKRPISPRDGYPTKFIGAPRLNLFRRRRIPTNSCIHESVLERQGLLPEYALSQLPETYTVERELPNGSPYPAHLCVGQTLIVGIHARAKWNDTTLRLYTGEKYLFDAADRWNDARISCGPAGYESPSLLFRWARRLTRFPKANWFALIGAIGQKESTAFVIGERHNLDVEEDGVLYCFANDLPFMYRNNSGVIRLAVTRLV